MKNLFILLTALFINQVCLAQNGLSISGKIKMNAPELELSVSGINGKTMLKATIQNDQAFNLGTIQLIPDLYVLKIGKVKQQVFLNNTPIAINGYFDTKNTDNTELTFAGLEDFETFNKLSESYRKMVNPINAVKIGLKNGISPYMVSALGYAVPQKKYEDNKALLELIPADAKSNISYLWLKQRTDSMSRYAIGATAAAFTFQDEKGKMISLSDFKGKYVLLDFWASWCAPCRAELVNLKKIYKELKTDQLEFISISVDDKENAWRKALKEEQIPWITLWETKGFKASPLQLDYGFKSIPCLVLIDPEGKVAARNIRGEAIRNTIINSLH